MSARHCTGCGHRLESGDRGGEPGRPCPGCGRPQWENPVPCAGAVVVDDAGRVLLAKRAREPFLGWWDIPGGFMDPGETPEDTVRRELLEETGLVVEPVRYLASFSDTYEDDAGRRTTVNVFFECRVAGGALRAADDVTELAWFRADALPERMAFSHGHAVLDAWRGR